MRLRTRSIVFASLLLLVAGFALAQVAGTTSSISGSVTTGGKPLPGATVSVSSASLQGVRTNVTGDGGGYTFPALPPGEYSVTFELEGMQKVTKKVSLSLATPSRADADLKVASVTEAITVTAAAPAVLETTQIGTNFKQEEIALLPVGRNMRQTVLLAPGVNPNGVNNQITINGGPSYDNVFMVNGVVVNENLRGQPHNLFIEDAIQETAVMTAGISAEYGRFTGGVVSTLTKSGSNEFDGSLRDSFTNPRWTADVDYPGFATPASKTNQVYEATLGGRILKDRLWFFGAGRKAKTAVSVSTLRTGIGFSNGFDEKRFEGKLTGAITPSHNLVGSWLKVKNLESNNFFAPIYDAASIVTSRELPNELRTVNYSGVITSNLLAEVAWSQKTFAFINSGGRFTDRIAGTWIGDSVTGGRMNAPVFCGVCTPEERNSDSVGGKGTYYLSTHSMGNHALAFGGDRFHETRIVNNHQSGSDYTVTARVIDKTFAGYEGIGSAVFPRFDASTQLTWQPIFLNSNGTDLKSDALYLNDHWDFNNRLSFNVGVRYDKNKSIDADKNLISDDSNISPRLGALLDLKGNGRQKVSLSVARYAAKITDGSNVLSTAQAAGSPGTFTWQYRDVTLPSGTKCTATPVNPAGTAPGALATPAQGLATLFAWYDCIGGDKNTANLFNISYPGYGSRFKGSLKTPSVDEITAGYGFQIGHNGFVRTDIVHREWHNFYAAEVDTPALRIIPPNNVASDMRYTVNDDQFTRRKYNGVEIQGGWRIKAFNIAGNYTWSTLKGNDVSEGAGTATIRNTPGELFYPEYNTYAQRRPDGYLAQDRRHRARIWAGYDLPSPIGNFNVSAIESYDSGFSYSAIGAVDPTGRNANFSFTGAPANPGYTLSAISSSENYFFSKRGAFRSDSRLGTDLAINYSLPLMGKVQFFARGDVLNVFNNQKIVDPSLIDTSVITSRTGTAVVFNPDGTVKTLNSGLSPFNPFKDTPIECPQGAAATVCASMHANYQLGANFGKAISADAFQYADRSLATRTYRFSAGIRF
jgi:outer membrane receptor protein involved in Fe transport